MLNDRLDVGLMFSFRNPAAWRRPFPDVYRDELDLGTAPPVLFRPVFGSPDTVATKLNESTSRVLTTHLAFGVLPGMNPARTRTSLELIASQVAPQLR